MKSLNERKIEKLEELVNELGIALQLIRRVMPDAIIPIQLDKDLMVISTHIEQITAEITALDKEVDESDKADDEFVESYMKADDNARCDIDFIGCKDTSYFPNCGACVYLSEKTTKVEQPTVGETLLKTIEEARKQGFTLEFKGMWWIEKAMEEYAKIYAQSQEPSRERIIKILKEYGYMINVSQYEDVADELLKTLKSG
jgi:hypothetical protein